MSIWNMWIKVPLIDVVLEVAKFINRTGLEVLPLLMIGTTGGGGPAETTIVVRSQLLDLFFRCFAYDDIDVSGAVLPLAGSFVSSNDQQQQQQQQPIVLQLLTIMYRQMRYPPDSQFDYEDKDEAEEEPYRTELRKLNQKLIRVASEACLQFTCQTLSQLQLPTFERSHSGRGSETPLGLSLLRGGSTTAWNEDCEAQ
jgi:exportin-T